MKAMQLIEKEHKQRLLMTDHIVIVGFINRGAAIDPFVVYLSINPSGFDVETHGFNVAAVQTTVSH